MLKLLNVKIYKTALPKIGYNEQILDTEFFMHNSYEVDELFERLSPEIKPNTTYLMSICNTIESFPYTKHYYILVRKDKTIIFDDVMYQNKY